MITRIVKLGNRAKIRCRLSQTVREELASLRELNGLRKLFPSHELNILYNNRRKLINKHIQQEKIFYSSSIINAARNKSKAIWRLVNDSRGGKLKRVRAIELDCGGELVSDTGKLVDIFADYFSKVIDERMRNHFGNNISNSCTVSTGDATSSMVFLPATGLEVSRVIAGLSGGYSTGHDGVSLPFVRRCADVLSESIALLVNLSVDSGVFPDKLKLSTVSPVPKKGDLRDIKNYRPISILSIFSKIFEKIAYNRITSFLDKYSLLSDSQHGFRKGRSTETATTQFIQRVNDELDKNKFVVSIFFDLSRAFDTIHPGFVSEKIEKLGLRGNINKWITSYLTNRNFYVKMGNKKSNLHDVNTGTPQGGVLGPLIFLLYVGDMPDHIREGAMFAYADDTTIVVSDSSPVGVCRRIERVIVQFKNWCDSNRLVINLEKTVLVQFRDGTRCIDIPGLTVGGINIKFDRSARLLGTMVDSHLSWEKNVDYIAGKLNSAYYAISTLKNRFDGRTLRTIYYATFYPHLSYNIVAWGLSSHGQRLFILQKRVVRLIYDLEYRESCRSTFRKERILTFISIYLLKVLCYIYKSRLELVTHSDVHSHNTRGRLHLRTPQHNYSFYEKSPLYAGISLFNILPEHVRHQPTFCCFKTTLRQFLIDHCFYNVGEYVSGRPYV